MDEYVPGISIAAGSMMLKWNLMDQHLKLNQVEFEPNEVVNVYLNFESVLRNLKFQRNADSKVAYFKQDIVLELEASILNLLAHYRAYFRHLGCIPVMYFYYTDLRCDEPQQMTVYNRYYREYYKNRYMNNPDIRALGDIVSCIVVPEVQLILQYVPNCHFLISDTYDSSVIPYVISRNSKARNVVISGDVFDTLYMLQGDFTTFYIKRRFSYFMLCSEIDSVIKSILKNVAPDELTIFRSELYYRLLLAVKGSKIRNIKGGMGLGAQTLVDILQQGIRNGVVLQDFSSIDSIIDLFPIKYHNPIKIAFYCTGLDMHYELLSQADKDRLMGQIVDKIDPESLQALNSKRFTKYPINLPSLLE